ncbi:MAG TPA: cell division/cell wall cluster transcriptional repressor MraZ, partial [Firmicutes bacterium]|nr:cell division/cell wall cluster transcriptional repressor MraZ [Candidatus Fermentithermobacillaceae bacterium]
NRLEIWDRTKWEEMKARIHQEFAKLAETVTAI